MSTTCDGWCERAGTVTHIGNKGYAYCTACATIRRESGYESTRKMRHWELRWIAEGRSLPSYKAGPEPKEEAA